MVLSRLLQNVRITGRIIMKTSEFLDEFQVRFGIVAKNLNTSYLPFQEQGKGSNDGVEWSCDCVLVC